MASIKQTINKNGEYVYTLTLALGYSKEGKRLTKRVNYKPTRQTPKASEKEAMEHAIMLENEEREKVLSGEYDQPEEEKEKVTFSDFMQYWDSEWLSTQVYIKDMTQKCREDYMRSLRNHAEPIIGDMELTEISTKDINKIINRMIRKDLAPKTIRSVFGVVNQVFDYAFREDWIIVNPCLKCRKLPKAKSRKEKNIFTIDQARRFLNDALNTDNEYQIGGHSRKYTVYNGTGEEFEVKPYTESRQLSYQFKVFFTLALFGGFRRGELCALTWNNINYKHRIIKVTSAVTSSKGKGEEIKEPKTESGKREVMLPQMCFDMLKKLKAEQRKMCIELGSAWEGKRGKEFNDNFVFIQNTGKRMNVQTPTKKFRKILIAYNKTVPDELQLPLIRLHDLRHTYASHAKAAGISGEDLATILGHSDSRITERIYTHQANKRYLEEISEAIENVFTVAP